MNRRRFLSLLSSTPIAAVMPSAALLELLEPRKLIMLPPVGGWAELGTFTPTLTGMTEYQRVLRKAFIPKMYLEIYKSAPRLFLRHEPA